MNQGWIDDRQYMNNYPISLSVARITDSLQHPSTEHQFHDPSTGSAMRNPSASWIPQHQYSSQQANFYGYPYNGTPVDGASAYDAVEKFPSMRATPDQWRLNEHEQASSYVPTQYPQALGTHPFHQQQPYPNVLMPHRISDVDQNIQNHEYTVLSERVVYSRNESSPELLLPKTTRCADHSKPTTVNDATISSNKSTNMQADAQLLLEAASQAAHEARSITPTASTTSSCAEVSQTRTSQSCPYTDLVSSSDLVSEDLYGTVSDALFISLSQMELCRLTEEDRFGNYKHREVGFVGMCCKFCGGLPGFGKHYPGSFQSLLSGSHCVRIVKHMRSDCRSCPPKVRKLLEGLGTESDIQNCTRSQSQMDHGSRKRFVAHVWSKLQEAQGKKIAENTYSPVTATRATESSELCSDKLVVEDASLTWASVFESGELVEPKDLHLIPNSSLFALAQMKPWPLTAEDRIGRHKDQRLGFVGMCCNLCGGKTGRPRFGRYFPSSLKTLAKPASCDRIANHIANECPKCPPHVRNVMRKLLHFELSSHVRYGSRNIFFQRLWYRLHAESPVGTGALASVSREQSIETNQRVDHSQASIPWEQVLEGSCLVSGSDRGRVPDGHLIAMAQLEPCKLKVEDQMGWYKDRPIGFSGLACRHCKGRPGVGRYFPNTLRTFSQNNYCQIVNNHLKKDCPGCPEDLRKTLVGIFTNDISSSQLSPGKRSSVSKGSRKALYDRIWSVIHEEPHPLDLSISGKGTKTISSVLEDRMLDCISANDLKGAGSKKRRIEEL